MIQTAVTGLNVRAWGSFSRESRLALFGYPTFFARIGIYVAHALSRFTSKFS
jgi:hypothetical protein